MKATLQMVNEAHDISDARVIAQDEGFLVYSDDIGGEEGVLAWALTEDDALVSAVRDSENREPYARMLRVALRDVVGPSIDDVREVWQNPLIWIRWWSSPQPDMSGVSRSVCEVVDRLGRGILDGRQRFDTERAALQAAYDAGVARRGGDGA